MFSHADQPTRPVMCTSGPSIRPHAKYPMLPSTSACTVCRIPTPSECLAPGLRTVTSCTPSPVDQQAQLEVDLTRGQLACVEARAFAVDLGDTRNRLVELDQPARVKARLRDRAGRGYRVHTITSLSYGSYVSISRSITARIAISSEASTTMSSPS